MYQLATKRGAQYWTQKKRVEIFIVDTFKCYLCCESIYSELRSYQRTIWILKIAVCVQKRQRWFLVICIGTNMSRPWLQMSINPRLYRLCSSFSCTPILELPVVTPLPCILDIHPRQRRLPRASCVLVRARWTRHTRQVRVCIQSLVRLLPRRLQRHWQ